MFVIDGFFFFEQKTAYELRISDWSSDVCSSDLGLERDPSEVVESTTAEPEPGTQLLYVTVTDPDPEMAQTLANGLADTFVKDIQEFEPGVTEGTVPRLPSYVFVRAELPVVPVPPNRLRTFALAALFVLLVSAVPALLLDYSRKSPRLTSFLYFSSSI